MRSAGYSPRVFHVSLVDLRGGQEDVDAEGLVRLGFDFADGIPHSIDREPGRAQHTQSASFGDRNHKFHGRPRCLANQARSHARADNGIIDSQDVAELCS